jgi:iron(III) transport system permease protein
MTSQFARQDPLLMDSARLCPRDFLSVFFGVLVPISRWGVLAGASLAFALSLGEVGSTIVTVPPGIGTLALKLYNLLHYGAGGSVAALSLVTAAITLCVSGAFFWLSGRRCS